MPPPVEWIGGRGHNLVHAQDLLRVFSPYPQFSLPPGVSTNTFILLSAISCATSALTAFIGIGGGALLLGILASALPPRALIPVHGAVQLGSNFGRFLTTIRHVRWKVWPAFALGTALAAVVSGRLSVSLSAGVVECIVGVFVVITAIIRVEMGWLGSAGPLVAGLVSTFLTFFVGATGTFVAAYTKSLMLERFPYVATQAVLMTTQHAVKVIVLQSLGFHFRDWATLIVAMICTGFAGTLLGTAALRRTTDERFRYVLNFVLVIVGIRLLLNGIRDVLHETKPE